MKKVSEQLVGKKVLGDWGTGGFTYGFVSEILPEYNEILVKWDENEDDLTESYYELKDITIAKENITIDKIGVHILL